MAHRVAADPGGLLPRRARLGEDSIVIVGDRAGRDPIAGGMTQGVVPAVMDTAAPFAGELLAFRRCEYAAALVDSRQFLGTKGTDAGARMRRQRLLVLRQDLDRPDFS